MVCEREEQKRGDWESPRRRGRRNTEERTQKGKVTDRIFSAHTHLLSPLSLFLSTGPSVHDLNDDGYPEVIDSSEVFDGRTGILSRKFFPLMGKILENSGKTLTTVGFVSSYFLCGCVV